MVESRFRVANGMSADVREAFLSRPGLVDGVAGFLGMDVYTAADDTATFHLVTRWTDRVSYESWHRSDAHRHSHAFIPRGLKLDAAYTRLTVLERLAPSDDVPALAVALADAAPALAQWLVEASGTYVALLSANGESCAMNQALADRLGVERMVAHPIAPLLVNDEAQSLVQRITDARASGKRTVEDEFLLNMVNATHSPFTLRCHMDVQPQYVMLFAEDGEHVGDNLRDALLHTNNQLSVLAREREWQRKALATAHEALGQSHAELAATLETLDSSYWHIARIHDLLPLCMDCGEVKTTEDGWQSVTKFLMENARSPFISHGYCPDCSKRLAEASVR